MLTVTRRYKPADVAVRAEVDVQATEDTTVGAVITFGLTALGEQPGRLFNYGIAGRRITTMSEPLPAGLHTVYADRD